MFSRHLLADTLNLASLKSRHRAERDADFAFLGGSETHLHKSLRPPIHRFADLPAKAVVSVVRTVVNNHLSIEPSRTIAGNLPVEADGRERPYSQPVTALAEVVGLPTLDDVLRDLPMIGIDPLDKTRPAQRLQAADVGAHESFGVLALPLKAVADALQVPARPVDVGALLDIAGDVAVGRPWTGNDWGCFNDHVSSHLLDPRRVLELHVMDPAIDAVDDQVDALAHLVSGETLGQDPADDLLAQAFAVKGELANTTLLGETIPGERPMDRVDGLIAVVQILQDLLRTVGERPSSRLKLGGQSVSLQVPDPADHQVAVLPDEEGRALPWSQVDHALLLLLALKHLIEPGHPLGLDLVLQFGLKLDLALVTQFLGDQFARPVADTVGDVVSGNVENAAIIEDAANHNVSVGVAGVVMVDRDPVEPGGEIQFHQIGRASCR